MPRPPGNADKQMLAAAKRLVARSGFAGLKVREVADLAGVNLGMFHYHFKTREQFVRILIAEMYGDFFIKLKGSLRETIDPMQDLRAFMFELAQALTENRVLLMAIVRDLMNEEAEVFRLMRRSMPPHVLLMRKLVQRCQRAGALPRMPFSGYAPLFFGALAQPLIFHEMSRRVRGKGDFFDLSAVMSTDVIQQRIDIVLSGMKSQL